MSTELTRELTLNVPGSTWTEEDWKKSVPEFIPER